MECSEAFQAEHMCQGSNLSSCELVGWNVHTSSPPLIQTHVVCFYQTKIEMIIVLVICYFRSNYWCLFHNTYNQLSLFLNGTWKVMFLILVISSRVWPELILKWASYTSSLNISTIADHLNAGGEWFCEWIFQLSYPCCAISRTNLKVSFLQFFS